MYEKILADTLRYIESIPMSVPASGGIAGPAGEYRPAADQTLKNDNFHYPMGQAYYRLGLRGIAEKAAENAKKVENPELLRAVSEVYTALSAWFLQYASVVETAAKGDARLQRIGENLRALSHRAPIHFDEAIQLSYLMWKIRAHCTCGGDIGRLDVHLRPFFERDIADGYMTEEDALALICRYWELLNENNSGDTLINVMLGGRDPDGADAGSRLSVLMLRATRLVGKCEPHVSLRVHPKLSEDIRREALEVQCLGQGQASQYNDEVVIPSLVEFGIPEEYACRYTNDGCSEIMIDGHSAISFNHIDAVAVFELAFNNGDWAERTYRTKNKYWTHRGEAYFASPDAAAGFTSGRAEDCTTFAEFYDCYLAQYRFQTRHKASILRRAHLDCLAGEASSVLLNGTFEEVLENGKDLLGGGLPVEVYMVFSGSIPTAAESLAAVKKLVFEEKAYTVAQVKEAIRVNFEGHEEMRRRMLACPKFGNDEDEIDLLAADIALRYCDWLEEYRKETGFAVMPALYGWRFVDEAYAVAATPDGRKYADPIAEHYCATPGKAICGPTALLRSVMKAKKALYRAVGGSPIHISLPRMGTAEECRNIVDALMKAAAASGIEHLNIGIYDAALLREAQKHPESHEDVIVRVWGYSARFVDLSREMQEHVIARILAEGA